MKAITDSQFESEVLKAKGLVLVDFWADGIRSIPTLFLFKDGKQIDVKVGLNSKSALEAWIDANA